MRSKQRVLAAVDHVEPDRVPVDFGATSEVAERLCRELGTHYDGLLERFGVDFRRVNPRYVGPAIDRPVAELFIGAMVERNADGTLVDIWGRTYRETSYSTGVYLEVVAWPLADAESADDVAAHRFPIPDWFDHTALGAAAAADHAVLAGWVRILNTAFELRGMERLMLDMALDADLAHAIIGRVTDFYYEDTRRALEAAGGSVDIFCFGDDYGTQRGPLISPSMWDEFVRPYLARVVDLVKSYGVKIYLHSCGSVRQFIPRFIEIGVDILDPIQAQAEQMIAAELKAEFGDEICFHGGLDTQDTIPFGTPAQVRELARRMLAEMAPGGGYIAAPDHHLQADVPTANILALYDALHEFGA